MTDSVRAFGLEWILNELEGVKLPAETVSRLADSYEKHFDMYSRREGTVAFIAGNLDCRRHLQPVLYFLKETYKVEVDDD